MPLGKWNFSGFRLLADYYPDFLIPYFGSWSTSSSKSSSTSICCHSDQLISLVIYIEILLTMLWSISSPLTSISRSSTPGPQSPPPYVNGSCAGASPQSDDVRNNDNPELSGQRGLFDMTPHCLMSTLVPSIGHLSPYKSIWPSIICCWCCPATAVGVVGAIQFREQVSSGQGLFSAQNQLSVGLRLIG